MQIKGKGTWKNKGYINTYDENKSYQKNRENHGEAIKNKIYIVNMIKEKTTLIIVK